MTDQWLASGTTELALDNGLDSSGDDTHTVMMTPVSLQTPRNDCSALQRQLGDIRQLLRQTDEVLLQSPGGAQGLTSTAPSVPSSGLTDVRCELANSAHHLRQLLQKAESRPPLLLRAASGSAINSTDQSVHGDCTSGGCSYPPGGPDPPQCLPASRNRPSWTTPLQTAFSSLPARSFHPPPSDGASIRDLQRQLDQVRCALDGLTMDSPVEVSEHGVSEDRLPVFNESTNFPPAVAVPTEPRSEQGPRFPSNRRESTFSCFANSERNFTECGRDETATVFGLHARLHQLEVTVSALTRQRSCHGGSCRRSGCCCEERRSADMLTRCLQLLEHQQHQLTQLRQLIMLTNTRTTQLEPEAGHTGAHSALNNQVAPSSRANNYWDNFRSYARQNRLSSGAARVCATAPGPALDPPGCGDWPNDDGSAAQRPRAGKENRNRENQRMRRATDSLPYSRNSAQLTELSGTPGDLLAQLRRQDGSCTVSARRSSAAAAVISPEGASANLHGRHQTDATTPLSAGFSRKQSNRAGPPPPLTLTDESWEQRALGSVPGAAGPSSAPPHELLLRNTLTPTGVSSAGGVREVYRWPPYQASVSGITEPLTDVASSELDVSADHGCSEAVAETAVKLPSGASSDHKVTTDHQPGNTADITSSCALSETAAPLSQLCPDSLPVRDSGSAPPPTHLESSRGDGDPPVVDPPHRQRSISTPECGQRSADIDNSCPDTCSPDENHDISDN